MASKTATYSVEVLARKKRNRTYSYEWIELRTFGTKKEAVEYAKRESKMIHRAPNTGRFVIRKETIEAFYENGRRVD